MQFDVRVRCLLAVVLAAGAAGGVVAVSGCGSSSLIDTGLPGGRATLDQVIRGRQLVIQSACASCHSQGKVDPSSPTWLAGYDPAVNPGEGVFQIGPPGSAITTYAANITPDTATGIGRFTDRQIFNELRFGLDPASTPDVEITSTTPGQGNFPATPHYLGPPMPWPSFRHMSDIDIWAIVAYIKHGVKAVSNAVPASGAPADFWASFYTAAQIGPPPPLPGYPESNEIFAP